MRVTLYIGLPGSGKTFAAKRLAMKTGAFLIDDCDLNRHLIEPARDSGRDVVIADPLLCTVRRADIEKRLREWFGADVEMKFIAFANDPHSCFANVKGRADEREISYGFIQSLSARYNVRQFDEYLPVYRPSRFKADTNLLRQVARLYSPNMFENLCDA